MTNRPIGVAILAILSGLLGISVIGTGLWLFDIISMFSTIPLLLAFVASLFVVFGGLGLAIAYGMWKGLAWARWLAMMAIGLRFYQILIALALVSSSDIPTLSSGLLNIPQIAVFGSGALAIFIDLLISTYLVRPSVETFFDDHETPLAYLTMLIFPVPFLSLVWTMILSVNNNTPYNVTQGLIFSIITIVSGATILAAPKFIPEK
jgi:hypothetical protein